MSSILSPDLIELITSLSIYYLLLHRVRSQCDVTRYSLDGERACCKAYKSAAGDGGSGNIVEDA